MELPTYFSQFLNAVRLTDAQVDDCITGHTTLRNRLQQDKDLAPLIVSLFLQGSYRRATAIRPKNGARSDVDVIVVTRLDRSCYPEPGDAMDLFVPFLDRHYKGKYRPQGRSFGIELSYVDLDLVITAAPSEVDAQAYVSKAATSSLTVSEATDWRWVKSWLPPDERTNMATKALMEKVRQEAEWKTQPLWIPDRDVKAWRETHPLEQIKWTQGKNARCGGRYVHVVQALKAWQRATYPDDRPKGYPLEHLIGAHCPDNIASVAAGVTQTVESIVSAYAYLANNGGKPELLDHGVSSHNVFKRVTPEEFKVFYEHVVEAARLAREALDDNTSVANASTRWNKLFGDKFPIGESTKVLDESSGQDTNVNALKGWGGDIVSPRAHTGQITPARYG